MGSLRINLHITFSLRLANRGHGKMRSIGPAHRDNVIPDSSGADDSSDADESGDDYHPTEEDEVGKQVDRPAATIPYDITTDFVSFKQLKDWCTEKGMTSHNLRLLIALSVRRTLSASPLSPPLAKLQHVSSS